MNSRGRRRFILAGWWLLFLLPILVQAEPWELVVSVGDGDSISLSSGEKVRYLGINAPERGLQEGGEFLAEEAWNHNKRLVKGREVRLEFDLEKRDRYGRLLAYVFLKDGLFVNEELVRQGYAHVLVQTPRLSRFEPLLKAQREALKERRGIWTRALEETDRGYRGHKTTLKFHRLSCPLGSQIRAHNLVLFNNKKEAYWLGYSPCRQCKP
jgi:endonuclease YncB( thermonuclease family)